ncbi:heparinase II/III family protein [Planktomarina temperata]|nr:heparinase II/III family protein [Planktomarina temperata]
MRIWFKIFTPSIQLSKLPRSKNFLGLLSHPARRKSSLVGPTEWNLLNESGKLEEIGWQSSSRSKLWRYNQHYFDDLNASGWSDRLNWHNLLIVRWIDENPPFSGHGWDPYPTSIRIVNWIKWSSEVGCLPKKIEESLALQVRWLEQRLEWHLLGNHLFVNAKALIFAGIYFEGVEAKKWFDRGIRILERQVPEQILPDGAQFELTPMYHALAVEDLLDLINICEKNCNDISQIFEWRSTISKMLNWLRCMSHPDGTISFFNDAAFCVAPSNVELFSYANRLGFDCLEPVCGLTDLQDSGFVRLQSADIALIADLGSVGPDYLPGHAHADTLSFELSFCGERVFVNSGTSEYGAGEERQRQRGTLAHNTVCVKGLNSSEVWSGFRVGARAKITRRSVSNHDDFMYLFGEHDGYARTHCGLNHAREFSLYEKLLIVSDTISLPFPAEARLYCHPELKLEQTNPTSGILVTPRGRKLSWFFTGADRVDLLDATWHPEFGKSIKNKCIAAQFTQKNCEFTLKWD